MPLIKVVSSMPLDDATRKKIESVFNKKHSGEKVGYEYSVNASVLGGLMVIDNDMYYDATLKGQLSKIRQNIR